MNVGVKRLCRRAYAWSKTILGRSILFSLAMLILTLIVAGLVTDTSQKALRDEIVNRNTAQAEAVVEQLALSLGKTMDIQREMLYDTDLNRLGVAPGYYSYSQRIMAMLRAMERMRVLTSSSPLIDQSFFWLLPSARPLRQTAWKPWTKRNLNGSACCAAASRPLSPNRRAGSIS